MSERPANILQMSVFGNLDLVKDIKKRKTARTAVIFEGGGQKGVIGGGVAWGMEDVGVIGTAQYLIGVSSGACAALYTATGQAYLGTTVYFEENVKNNFADKRRMSQIMNIGVVEEAMRRGNKRVDVEAIKKSNLEVIVGVLDSESGEEKYIRIKELEDPIKAVVASIAAAVFCGGRLISIHGHAYLDGSLGDPIPVRFAIEELGCENLVVVKNGPFKEMQSPPDYVTWLFSLAARYPYGYSRAVQEAILSYKKKYNEAINFMRDTIENDSNHRLIVIAPKSEPLGTFDMDQEKIRSVALEARQFAYELFN